MSGNLVALLDDVEAAEILRLKPATLQQWRSRGVGPEFVLVGDLPRYSRAALESYIQSRTITPKLRTKPESAPKRRGRPRGIAN
jgi:hypothetical protein